MQDIQSRGCKALTIILLWIGMIGAHTAAVHFFKTDSVQHILIGAVAAFVAPYFLMIGTVMGMGLWLPRPLAYRVARWTEGKKSNLVWTYAQVFHWTFKRRGDASRRRTSRKTYAKELRRAA